MTKNTNAVMGLRARWIVDPTDHTGRRLIAVWSRQAPTINVPTSSTTSTPPPTEQRWPRAS